MLINVHNHDPTATIRYLSGYVAECTSGERRTDVFILGDWNFPEEGSTGLTTSRRGETRQSSTGRERRRWAPVLRQVTELAHGRPM